MTTPTPAQTKAALIEYDRFLLCLKLNENTTKTRLDAMASALTAAAHVETMSEHIARDIREGRFPERSAAQVGEQDIISGISQSFLIQIAINAKLATIERCAQVINDCLIKLQKQHDEDDQFSGVAVAALLADLVATIRKLKDK